MLCDSGQTCRQRSNSGLRFDLFALSPSIPAQMWLNNSRRAPFSASPALSCFGSELTIIRLSDGSTRPAAESHRAWRSGLYQFPISKPPRRMELNSQLGFDCPHTQTQWCRAPTTEHAGYLSRKMDDSAQSDQLGGRSELCYSLPRAEWRCVRLPPQITG